MEPTAVAIVAPACVRHRRGYPRRTHRPAVPLIFLPFISSAFVPTRTMPGPVRAFADNQPMTSIINTIRDLFTQRPVSTGIWIALAWCLGLLIVAYALAMAAYRRKIA